MANRLTLRSYTWPLRFLGVFVLISVLLAATLVAGGCGEQKKYKLSVSVTGNGSTTPAVGTYEYKEKTRVYLKAVPDEGWEFDQWLGDVTSPSSANTNIVMSGDRSVTAVFKEIKYTLTLEVNDAAGGVTTPEVGEHIYSAGALVDITATPSSGWQFDNWTGEVSDPASATTSVTMDEDKTITANFSRIMHTLSLAVNQSAGGTTSPTVGPHDYPEAEVVNISATPNTGWYFVNWTGDVADPNSEDTTVTVDQAKTVTANFTNTAFSLTMAVNDPTGGSTSPAVGVAMFGQGRVVTVTAVAATGWQFDGWTGPVADAGSATTTVTMDADKTLTANFSVTP